MNENEEQLKGVSKKGSVFAGMRAEGLSLSEKSEMRRFLKGHVEASLKGGFFMASIGRFFNGMLFRQSMAFSAIAAVLLVTSGIGVASASEKALPGEFLYRFKISIVEPIEGVGKRSPEDRALWEEERARRRLEEANMLAATGKLGEKESEQIEALIEKHHENRKKYNDDESEDEFEMKIENESEKIEVKIETIEGKKRFRISERELKGEDREDDEAEEKEDDEDDDQREKEFLNSNSSSDSGEKKQGWDGEKKQDFSEKKDLKKKENEAKKKSERKNEEKRSEKEKEDDSRESDSKNDDDEGVDSDENKDSDDDDDDDDENED